MSAFVETWVGELAKLREKVLAQKRFLSKAKEGEVEEKEATNKTEKVASVQNQRGSATTTMSEATVCLLMDRFVPC